MAFRQNFDSPLHFPLFLDFGPFQVIPEKVRQFLNQWPGELTKVSQQGTAQEQVVEMDDFLTPSHGRDFPSCIIRIGFYGRGIFPCANGQGLCVEFAWQA